MQSFFYYVNCLKGEESFSYKQLNNWLFMLAVKIKSLDSEKTSSLFTFESFIIYPLEYSINNLLLSCRVELKIAWFCPQNRIASNEIRAR